MFVLILCDFCGFISIAYTTLNKLLAVFVYNICRFTKKLEFQLDCFAAMTHLKVFFREWLFAFKRKENLLLR